MIYPDEARLGIWKRRSRHGTLQMTSTAPRVRQPHQLNGNQRHMHVQSIEIKYCADTRPGAKLGRGTACRTLQEY
eukprot:scaffold281477_cov14-Tisochrysis_lutea.AAC.1